MEIRIYLDDSSLKLSYFGNQGVELQCSRLAFYFLKFAYCTRHSDFIHRLRIFLC